MSDSTPRPRRRKQHRPKKPYPDFPLTPHPCGAWQKKIRGRIFYFGRWGHVVNGKMERIPGDGWEEALEQYKAVADDLHAGRTPRVSWDKLTVAGLCNAFLTAKLRKHEAGEMGAQAFDQYREITDLIVGSFGKLRPVADLAADDFEKLRAAMAERWGPVKLGNAITYVRGVFRYGDENGLMDRLPQYGSEFKKPALAVVRRHRAGRGELMLEADQLRALIAAARQPIKAMVLLGINAGFGNVDCSSLPVSAVNLDTGWLDFPRPKTGIGRRCPLWPETVEALREVLAERPAPKDKADEGLAFLCRSGRRWVRYDRMRKDSLGREFRRLLDQLGLHRSRVGFYTLRHTFRTVADATRDPVAIDLIMGHSDPSMGAHYRERVDDDRLVAVADYVRQWLFGDTGGEPDDDSAGAAPEAEEADVLPQPAADDTRPVLRLYVG
jgi:integrase